jgi:hypothetical protein
MMNSCRGRNALQLIPRSWLASQAVEFILELLAAGQSESEILSNYPGLTREDILACLSYASYLAHVYKAYPIPA